MCLQCASHRKEWECVNVGVDGFLIERNHIQRWSVGYRRHRWRRIRVNPTLVVSYTLALHSVVLIYRETLFAAVSPV